MSQSLTMQEMQDQYAGEWLLIAYTEIDEDLGIKRGEVLEHSANRDEVYRALLSVQGRKVAIEYAGTLPEDLAVVL